MKTLYLEITRRTQKIAQKQEGNVLWYDWQSKSIKKMNGNRIKFKYNFATKSMDAAAYSEDIIKNTVVDNKQDIENLVTTHADIMTRNVAQSSKFAIAVDVNEENYQQVEDILYEAGVRYSD